MPPSNTIRQPSPSTGVSIFFITVGVLLAIWSAVWYYYLDQNDATWKYFTCTGLFLSGIALLVIGALVGRIGREAQNADTPIAHAATPAVPAAPAAPVAPAAPAQTAPRAGS
jgi:hypothetical protein